MYVCKGYFLPFHFQCNLPPLPGYGQETGGVATLLYNEHRKLAVTVTVLEVLPWYLRPYFHTLRAEAFHGGPDYAGQNGTVLKPRTYSLPKDSVQDSIANLTILYEHGFVAL